MPARTRRSTLLALAGFLLAGLLPVPAKALTEDEALVFVEASVGEVMSLINASSSDQQRADGLLAIMERRAALDTISRYALGAAWRTASEAERAAWLSNFRIYVAAKYSRIFNDYRGEEILVRRAQIEGEQRIKVLTEIAQSGGAPVAVEWRLTDRGGRTELFDLVVEGVSLLTSERELMSALLERHGSIDGVIAAIQ
ncbi:MAG: ABC transporter substrate-binding protein [Pseudomonadota bacterium]